MSNIIDHLIFATPTLESGMDAIEKLLGIRPVVGGQHQGRGTHNALLALGENTYLEIIAPDPSQPDVPKPLWMKIDQATQLQLWTWAATNADLLTLEKTAKENKIPLGEIKNGNRTQPNGNILNWQLTEPVLENEDGIIPFFIDWGNTIHPAKSLPQAGEILELKIFHPSPKVIQAQFEKLGINVIIEKGERPKLESTIRTLDGQVKRFS